jgi:putative resolvase
MKLADWARKQGISYQTAFRWFQNGKMPCETEQMPSGTILVKENKTDNQTSTQNNVYVYTRVSTYERKDCLVGQAERCVQFANQQGLSVSHVVKEIASGMNDKRKKLMKMLGDSPTHIVVENKDRLTRFGFNYIEQLLSQQGCEVIVLNKDENDEVDLMKDLVSIITSFCCRLYGLRCGQNKAKKIKEELDS